MLEGLNQRQELTLTVSWSESAVSSSPKHYCWERRLPLYTVPLTVCTQVRETGSGEEGARRRDPRTSSAPRPRFFLTTHQPRLQDSGLVSVGCGTQRTAHTYREDHLQVIEHLDLLREAPAAPSHQVVLTAGRGVAAVTVRGLNSHPVKIPTEPLLWA